MFLALPVFAAVSVTGTVHLPSGAKFNGKVVFQLPFAGIRDIVTCNPGCPLTPGPIQFPITNGVLPSYASLTPNGDMDPLGTYYAVALVDSFGHLQSQFNVVIPASSISAAFDLGSAQQTSVTTTNVSLVNPANLTGNNTWTGSNTFNGPVVLAQAPTLPGASIAGNLVQSSGTASLGALTQLILGTGNHTFNQLYYASQSLTFGAIAAQTCATQMITVTGVDITKAVAVAEPQAEIGVNLIWTAGVNTNQVGVRVCNGTAGALTPNVVTWHVIALQ